MAEVNTGGGHDKGKGGKVKQKKVTLRVDFTPMVDMNMLLITFFMFCTSLSKPQTMEINMPTKDTVDIDEMNKVKASTAITLILGGDNKVFYYLGMFTEDKYDDPTFLIETNYSSTGLRNLLLARNAGIVNQINDLKIKRNNNEISEEEFRAQSIEIKKDETAPVVMIKATDDATYRNLIDALDEMQICNIGRYAVIDITEGDQYLVDKYLGVLPPPEEES